MILITTLKILLKSWTAPIVDKKNPNKYRIGIKQSYKVAKSYKKLNIQL